MEGKRNVTAEEKFMYRTWMSSLAMLIAVFTGPALADSGAPAAIVEEVTAPSTLLQTMQYVPEGAIIALAPGETLTLSYFASCATERVTGDIIMKVGNERSTVRGDGRLERTFVQCGGTNILLTGRQASKAVGIVIRGPGAKKKGPPELTVYSQAPVFVFSHPTKVLTIERVDGQDRESYYLPVDGPRLDLVTQDMTLTPGATYYAQSGNHSIVFAVAPTASKAPGHLIRRLIGL